MSYAAIQCINFLVFSRIEMLAVQIKLIDLIQRVLMGVPNFQLTTNFSANCLLTTIFLANCQLTTDFS